MTSAGERYIWDHTGMYDAGLGARESRYGHVCAYCGNTWYPSSRERNCHGCGAPATFGPHEKRALMERGRWPPGDPALEGNEAALGRVLEPCPLDPAWIYGLKTTYFTETEVIE